MSLPWMYFCSVAKEAGGWGVRGWVGSLSWILLTARRKRCIKIDDELREKGALQ